MLEQLKIRSVLLREAELTIGRAADRNVVLTSSWIADNHARLESVDLWIGTGGSTVAQLVLPILKPKAYLPVHWDGLDGVFLAGVVRKYSDTRLAALLSTSGVKLLPPVQYMDKWRLDRTGTEPVPNVAVKAALGF